MESDRTFDWRYRRTDWKPVLHPYHESEEVRQFSYNKDLLLSALMQSSDDYIYVCNMKEDPSCFRYSHCMALPYLSRRGKPGH